VPLGIVFSSFCGHLHFSTVRYGNHRYQGPVPGLGQPGAMSKRKPKKETEDLMNYLWPLMNGPGEADREE
jgi:hypothetical protein